MKDLEVILNWAGLAMSTLTVLGSLYLSVGMGLAACPLCYYQRTFAMGAFGVLLMGTTFGAEKTACVAGLALPLALAGLFIAGWHVWLEASGRMECPAGAFHLGTAPQQSLAALGLLSALLIASALSSDKPGSGWQPLAVSVVVAVSLGFACLRSAASPPKPPAEAYREKPIICRPLPAPVEAQ